MILMIMGHNDGGHNDGDGTGDCNGGSSDDGHDDDGPISYPELSLSGSGHTGLKNDPDWSIHKLLDPYPLWCSRARPV